ncbi:MAG: DUF3822 family protein [Bacteroidales bacterium]
MQTTIDFSKTEQYNLSIRLTPDGFSFYIVDPFGGGKSIFHTFSFSTLKSQLTQIEEIVYKHEQLLLPYRRTDLIVVSPHYTLVPNELLLDDKKEELLSFQFHKTDDKLLTNTLQRIPATNLFAMDEKIYSFLIRTFSINRVLHYATTLAEYFAERSRFGNYSKMYLHIDTTQIDIFCFERNRLKLNNSLKYNQINDAAYFVLNAWEKAGLHQTDDELHVCGISELRTEISPLLKKYLQRVSPLSPPTDWYVAPSNCEHLPLDLMTLVLCV